MIVFLWLFPGRLPKLLTLTTAMTSKKLYGKDLKEFDDIDVDDLLGELTAEELEILSKEVDPDVRT